MESRGGLPALEASVVMNEGNSSQRERHALTVPLRILVRRPHLPETLASHLV